MNKISQQNRNRLIFAENRLTAFGVGGAIGELDEKVKELNEQTKN